MSKTFFKTDKKENNKSRYRKFTLNLFPAYRGTGARIKFISSDFKEVHISLGLNIFTRNYVGTVFGGSIYGALDPIYMVQLINILGKDYIVWDKSAEIKFIRPIKNKVYARFLITDEVLNEIKKLVKEKNRINYELSAYFVDEKGVKYAEVKKLLFISDRKYYLANKK